jgi:hypothetical protein
VSLATWLPPVSLTEIFDTGIPFVGLYRVLSYLADMSAIDVETFKKHAEEFVVKAIGGEATIIERNGRRAVLMPCDSEKFPQTDALLKERLNAPGKEADAEDWSALRDRISQE